MCSKVENTFQKWYHLYSWIHKRSQNFQNILRNIFTRSLSTGYNKSDSPASFEPYQCMFEEIFSCSPVTRYSEAVNVIWKINERKIIMLNITLVWRMSCTKHYQTIFSMKVSIRDPWAKLISKLPPTPLRPALHTYIKRARSYIRGTQRSTTINQ